MNPLEIIKDGIRTSSWQKICDGYEMMTGEKLMPPQQEFLTVDNLKQTIVEVLECKTTQSETKEQTPIDDNDESNIDFEQKIESQDKKSLYGNKTVFITEAPNKKDIEDNKKLKDKTNNRAPKNRKPFKLFEVECSECHKQFKTPIDAGGDFGQKCKSCLRGLSKTRG